LQDATIPWPLNWLTTKLITWQLYRKMQICSFLSTPKIMDTIRYDAILCIILTCAQELTRNQQLKSGGKRKKTKIKNRYAQKYRSGKSGHRVSPEDTDIVLYMLYSYTSNEAKGLSIPVLSFSCRWRQWQRHREERLVDRRRTAEWDGWDVH